MSAESDALMQQFREAVYDRLTKLGAPFGPSPEGAIEQRSILFSNWQSLAREDTERLAPDLARHWAVADVTAFREVRADRRPLAEENIFKNISACPPYGQILSSIDARLVEQVKRAAASSEQKVADKLDRDVRALEQMQHEDAVLIDESPRVRKLEQQGASSIAAAASADQRVAQDRADLKASESDDQLQRAAELGVEGQKEDGFAASAEMVRDEPALEPADPHNTIGKVLDNATYKTRLDGSVLYLIDNRPAFVDHGQQILMEPKANDNEEAILGAVLLAREKYRGAFELTGSERFKRRAIEIILKHQVDVKLSHPQQETLHRELATANAAAAKKAGTTTVPEDARVKPLIGRPAADPQIAGSNFNGNEVPSTTLVVDNLATPPEKLVDKLVCWFSSRDGEDAIATAISRFHDHPRMQAPEFVDLPRGSIFADDLGDVLHKIDDTHAQLLVGVDGGPYAYGEIGSALTMEPTETWMVIDPPEHLRLSELPEAAESVAQEPHPSGLVPVRALNWWSVQHAAIHVWSKSEAERQADLEQLGPAPGDSLVYWFDRSGQQRHAPADPASKFELAQVADSNLEVAGFRPVAKEELRVRGATENSEVSAGSVFNVNLKEVNMSAVIESNDQEPKLILRGVKKLDNGEFDTTVLLFKGKGDYLQGYVKVGDQKHQVIAHINERKPDQGTGEVKPNFLKLSEPHAAGDDTKWKEIGFGNAVNRRKDDKPVFFDEVLFSVGNEVVKARVTKHVDEDMHRQLGFEESRKARPKEDSPTAPAGDASPKPKAPAAKEEEDAAGAKETARSATAPKARSPKSGATAAAANENAEGASKAARSRARARG